MVVGGMMGRKGEEKWEFALEYMRRLFGVDFSGVREYVASMMGSGGA